MGVSDKWAKVQLKLNHKGQGTIILNGQDVTNQVYALQLNTRAQKVTTLTVEMYVDELEVEAEANLAVIEKLG